MLDPRTIGKCVDGSRAGTPAGAAGLAKLGTLKIRVSLVRFRPWPPFPTRWFATGSGHRPRTFCGNFGPDGADPRTIGKWVGRHHPPLRPGEV